PLFSVPLEVLGPRAAGMSAGFGNMFANFGALTFAYALGVVKDSSGAFKWGFVATGALCIVGVGLAFLLARLRRPPPQSASLNVVRSLAPPRIARGNSSRLLRIVGTRDCHALDLVLRDRLRHESAGLHLFDEIMHVARANVAPLRHGHRLVDHHE